MDRGLAPQGLQNSAQSFNPGNPQNKRFALKLKGREMRVPDVLPPMAAQKSGCAIGTCDNCIIGHRFRLLGRSIWRPFRARRSWWTIPRVKTLS